MAYRSSRPDGMSQYNRSNPFFLVLRRLTDEQRKLANKISQDFISQRVILISVTLLYLVLFAFRPIHETIILTLLWAVVNTGISWMQYQHLQRILIETDLEKVEQMIFSNDYRDASLNNEDLVNTTNHCNWINGRLAEYAFQNRMTAIVITIIQIIMLICFMII